MLERFKGLFRKHVVQDVPAELEFCEFDCNFRICEQGLERFCAKWTPSVENEQAGRMAALSFPCPMRSKNPDQPHRAH